MAAPLVSSSQQQERCHYPFDLGLVNSEADFQLMDFSISHCGAECLFWLRHGLMWYYSFNNEEAINCFKQALVMSSNDNCIAAHWGISISHGPNYNTKSMTRDSFPSARAAYAHAQRVHELLQDASVRDALSDTEVAVFSALQGRFNPVDDDAAESDEIFQNTEAYCANLKAVYALHPPSARHPNNACVAALYAESLMQFAPWHLWDLETGQPTAQAVAAQKVRFVMTGVLC